MGSQLRLIAIEIESVLEPNQVTLTFIITLYPAPIRCHSLLGLFITIPLMPLLKNRCHCPHSMSEEVEVRALGKTPYDIPKRGHQIRSVPP